MTLLICPDGLIGDFLGVLPVAVELSRQDELHMKIHPEALQIFQLLPKKFKIQIYREGVRYDRTFELDIRRAFAISNQSNYYMSQSYFATVGLPVPLIAPKVQLEFKHANVPVCDFILAPFSRSLPPEQRWPSEQWQRLVELLPHRSFCVIGHDRDERNVITGSNVIELFNRPITDITSLLKNAVKGLVSVVSGPSHLAFHLGVKNFLLSNQQMSWGNNPDAILIKDYIPELKGRKNC